MVKDQIRDGYASGKEREHVDCLPGVKLPDSIEIEDDLEKPAIDRILLYFRWLRRLSVRQQNWQKPFIRDGAIIVNVGKGIEDKTLMTLCEVLSDVLPDGRASPYFPDRVMRKRSAYLLQL